MICFVFVLFFVFFIFLDIPMLFYRSYSFSKSKECVLYIYIIERCNNLISWRSIIALLFFFAIAYLMVGVLENNFSETFWKISQNWEVAQLYWKPCQTSKVKLVAKSVNAVNYFSKKLYLGCLIGLWIRLCSPLLDLQCKFFSAEQQ